MKKNVSLSPQCKAMYQCRLKSGYKVLIVLVLQILVLQVHAQNILSEYLFDETSGNIVIDSQGHQNGNIFNDVTRGEGINGRGITIVNSGYISLGKYLGESLNAVTLSAWINPAPVKGGWQGIIMHGAAGTPEFDTYALYINPDSKSIGFKTSGTTPSWVSTDGLPTLFDGAWHLVTVTYDGAQKIIYVDSDVVFTADATGSIDAAKDYNLLIGAGRDFATPNQNYEGMMDEARIYNYALTITDITNLYYLRPEIIYAERITISSSNNITTNKGTSQMSVAIEPANVSSHKINWSVQNGTGEAKIDNNGLLTGVANGDVTVIAEATDGSYISATKTVTISGQIKIVNRIANPSFELPDNGAKIGNPNNMVGWHSDKTGGTDSGRESNPSAPDGAMSGYSRNSDGRIYQAVDTLTASKGEYNFTIKSKITWNPNPTGYCVTYYSVMDKGADYLTRVVVDSLVTEINGSWAEITHNYVFDANSAYSGKVLLIEYAFFTVDKKDGWAGFDDLHLIKIDQTTGIEVLPKISFVKIFPNPTSENCILSVNSSNQAQFKIYNIEGKLVKSGNFTDSYNLKLSGLKKGIYLIRVENENKTEVAKLVLK
jgi:hypothetical protein